MGWFVTRTASLALPGFRWKSASGLQKKILAPDTMAVPVAGSWLAGGKSAAALDRFADQRPDTCRHRHRQGAPESHPNGGFQGRGATGRGADRAQHGQGYKR